MSDEARVQALTPFFTTRSTGTGLGLPIVQRIVEAHGGRVTIVGAPGHGTTVTIVLPEQEDHQLSSLRPQAGRTSLLP
jgi:signal transduction histidine kinase